MDLIWEALRPWLPFAIALVILGGGMNMLRIVVRRSAGTEKQLPRQLARIALGLVGVVLLVVLLPTTDKGILTDQTKGNLLGLLGLAITALITLSSTTLAANGMAGLMLRTVGSFRPGDFVRVEGYFGRVTERGLFHTEIQTEDRDLITLPNLYLATTPVRVVRSSGTIISADVGLGYDLPHGRIEQLLRKAASDAGLSDPFVLIITLADHAVTYRVAGFLEQIKTLVSARSALNAAILDTLHGAGVEIVSPDFVYQRRVEGDQAVIPTPERTKSAEPAPNLEQIAFDKAEAAHELETLRQAVKQQEQRLSELQERPRPADQAEADALERERTEADGQLAAARAALERAEAARREEDAAEKPPA